jgi:hypothetical protein
VGINVLIQYFRERFYSSSIVMPTKFSRLVLKKSDEEAHQAATAADAGLAPSLPSFDATYEYLDSLDEDEMKVALEAAESIELEEDEEYRVRTAVVTAVAGIRAKDGLTPPVAVKFLETVLETEDAEMEGSLVYNNEQQLIEEIFKKAQARIGGESSISDSNLDDQGNSQPSLSYVSSMLLADTLLATCQVNAVPTVFTDPASGNLVQSKGAHPLSRLLKAASSWLEWELYRENIRLELANETRCGISGNSQDTVAACAILAVSNLAIHIQSTTETPLAEDASEVDILLKNVASARFYMDIFDSEPHRNDLTRAACAQAISCVCCAADRFEKGDSEPVGLLASLDFFLDRILGMCDVMVQILVSLSTLNVSLPQTLGHLLACGTHWR